MGIPNLTTYVENNGHFSPITLKEVPSKKIVIDGFGLCYELHRRIKCGNYYEFYDEVVKFFKALKFIEVEAYVVIDGIDYENKKAASSKKRVLRRLVWLNDIKIEQDRIVVNEYFLPSFAKVVFIDALRESGINFFIADDGADRDIVSLANHLGCPVLTNDSDFFIFRVECGVIMLQKFELLPDFIDGRLKFFEYRKFLEKWLGKFPNPRTRLFIPYCLGNDFHGRHKLDWPTIKEKAAIDDVMKVLSKKSPKFEDYRTQLRCYFEYYEVVPKSFEDLSHNSVFSQPSFDIPPWIVSHFKMSKFSHDAMHFLTDDVEHKIWRYVLAFEDLAKDSAWAVTNSVLMFVIGALLSSCDRSTSSTVAVHVVQHRDADIGLEWVDIFPLLEPCHFNVLKDHTLKTVPDMPKVERQKILSHVFQCEDIAEQLESIPEGLKLVVIASRCWLKVISENIDHHFKAFAIALVLCFPGCEDPVEEWDCLPSEMKALDRIHYLAQWECMLYLANIFNQILDCPFAYKSVGRLFSATRFQYYFVRSPDPLFVYLSDIGGMLYGAITEGVLPEPPLCQPLSQQPEIRTENRFDLLAD